MNNTLCINLVGEYVEDIGQLYTIFPEILEKQYRKRRQLIVRKHRGLLVIDDCCYSGPPPSIIIIQAISYKLNYDLYNYHDPYKGLYFG